MAFFAKPKNGFFCHLLPRRVALRDLDAQMLAGLDAGFRQRFSSMGRNPGSARSAAAIFTLTRKSGRSRRVCPKSRRTCRTTSLRDLADKAALFSNLDEVIRADRAVVFVRPTGQGFSLHNLFVLKIDDWLIDDAERVLADCAQKLALKALLAAVDHCANKPEQGPGQSAASHKTPNLNAVVRHRMRNRDMRRRAHHAVRRAMGAIKSVAIAELAVGHKK